MIQNKKLRFSDLSITDRFKGAVLWIDQLNLLNDEEEHSSNNETQEPKQNKWYLSRILDRTVATPRKFHLYPTFQQFPLTGHVIIGHAMIKAIDHFRSMESHIWLDSIERTNFQKITSLGYGPLLFIQWEDLRAGNIIDLLRFDEGF
jgi:hypothetical protein